MKKKIEKKIRQHYVWREYLRSWANNEIICCKINGRAFTTNIMDIGRIKNFYKLHEIGIKEIKFIYAFIETAKIKDKNDKKKINEIIRRFRRPFIFPKLLKNLHLISKDTYDTILTNTEEDFYCEIEHIGKNYLDLLRNRNISFYNDKKERLPFLYYLCEQYFRTNKIQSNVLAVPQYKNIKSECVWPIIRHIWSYRMSKILVDKGNSIKLLKNDTTKNFITSDQPVMNISPSPHSQLLLYYPITPTIAVLIEENNNTLVSEYEISQTTEVDFYNQKVISLSLSQLYAKNDSDF